MVEVCLNMTIFDVNLLACFLRLLLRLVTDMYLLFAVAPL